MPTITPTDQREQYLTQLQPHVPEPIVAIGFLSGAGSMGAMVGDVVAGKALGLLSPLAGLLFRRKRTATRVATLRNDLVAVTASSVHLFAFPTDGRAFTVSGPPEVWSRRGLVVTADAPKRLTQQLHVVLGSGEARHYEISRAGGAWATFSDALRDELLRGVPA